MDDEDTPEDWGLFVLAIIPEEPWQERYGGVYMGGWTDQIAATRFALRMLTDPVFEATENAKFLEEYGAELPPIPDDVRPARIKLLSRDLALLLEKVDRRRLPGPGTS